MNCGKKIILKTMHKVKDEDVMIYTDQYGDKYCKIRVTIDVPLTVDEDYTEITPKEILDCLEEMDSSDIVDSVLELVEAKYVVRVGDNVPPTPEIIYVPKPPKTPQELAEIQRLEEAKLRRLEEELWKTFVEVLEYTIRTKRKWGEIFTTTKFNEEQLQDIRNSDLCSVLYYEDKRKYVITLINK